MIAAEVDGFRHLRDAVALTTLCVSHLDGDITQSALTQEVMAYLEGFSAAELMMIVGTLGILLASTAPPEEVLLSLRSMAVKLPEPPTNQEKETP